jgi:hypothetical protein
VDEEILSGMFTAVQDFIKDSFQDRASSEQSFALDELKLGEQNILMERGPNTFIAVIFEGSSRLLRGRTKKVLNEIEDKYRGVLRNWDGNMASLRGTTEIIETLLTHKADNGDDRSDRPKGPALGESIDQFISGGSGPEVDAGLEPGPAPLGPGESAPGEPLTAPRTSLLAQMAAVEGAGGSGDQPPGALAPSDDTLLLAPGAPPAAPAVAAEAAPSDAPSAAPVAEPASAEGVATAVPASPVAEQIERLRHKLETQVPEAPIPPYIHEAPVTEAPPQLVNCAVCGSPLDEVGPGVACPYCGAAQQA